MGGYGSGRWGWHNTKTAVEDGLKLEISGFKEGLCKVAAAVPEAGTSVEWRGTITWTRMQRQVGAIGFKIVKSTSSVVSEQGGVGPLVYLSYSTTYPDGTKTDSHYPVVTIWNKPNFGGRRWWWVCPVGKNNPSCKRKVMKLYLPPHASYFGCRTCYDLTYRSCQESHKYDGLYASLAASMSDTHPGLTGKEVERVLNWHKRANIER